MHTVKIIGHFIDGVIKGVSRDPSVICFMSMECLQLESREGTDLTPLMTSDD